MPHQSEHHKQRPNDDSSLESKQNKGQSLTKLLLEGLGITGLLIIGYMLALSPSHRVAAVWVFFAAWVAAGLAVAIPLAREFSQPSDVRQEKDKIAEHIRSIDELRKEGRALQDAFGHPDTDILDGQPDDWLDKVQIALMSVSKSHAQHFDEIVKNPNRYVGHSQIPSLTMDEIQRWQSNPRRPQQWPRITAVLNYLEQVRKELYNKLNK